LRGARSPRSGGNFACGAFGGKTIDSRPPGSSRDANSVPSLSRNTTAHPRHNRSSSVWNRRHSHPGPRSAIGDDCPHGSNRTLPRQHQHPATPPSAERRQINWKASPTTAPHCERLQRPVGRARPASMIFARVRRTSVHAHVSSSRCAQPR